jgi:hypothetical protein
MYLTFPTVDDEDPFGCNGTPLSFFLFLALSSHTIPAAGAVNRAAGPASRKVKPQEEGEEDDDEDEDDDIEVVTGAGTSSLDPSRTRLEPN